MFGFLSSLKVSAEKNLKNITLGTLAAILTVLPVYAQSRLVFIYPPINLSLGIDSLELFANEGVINKELAYYMNLAGVNDEEKQAFRGALLKKADLNPVEVSRFFNSPMGQELLQRVGHLFSIQGGRNGVYAIRGAMVQAAFDEEEGLTLLNFLRHLPVNMQFNLEEILRAATYLELLGQGTNAIVTEMKSISAPDLTLPNQKVIDTYGNALLVAFAEVYTAKNEEFRPYLTSSYAYYISKQPNPLHLVQDDAEIPFSELFNRSKSARSSAIYPRNIIPSND